MKRHAQLILAGTVALTALFAQGGTVAYWPMELNPATGGTARMIADVSGHGYDLKSELSDTQARTSSDIPFAAPPNGPADVTAASCAEIVNGTTLAVNAFSRGTASQTQTSDPLVLAMGLRRSFTLEGYMYVKSLKHGDNADTIIAFSGVNGNSDWIWNLTEPKANSNTRQVMVTIRGGGAGLSGGGVLATIDDAEIVGGWHHYALVFKFNADNSRSLWTFYLDGVNRGFQTMPNHATATQHDRFVLGGVNSGAHKTFDAKLAFWRVSDEALDSNALLCHKTFDTTIAYWPMQIRNRLTLGLRPDRRPYVFPKVLNQDGKSFIGGISIGRTTEFRVEDVTGDGASDGVFDCPVLARTRDSWQNAQNPCGFRKTGAGTMELNGTFLDSSFNELRRPLGRDRGRGGRTQGQHRLPRSVEVHRR